MVLVDVLSLKTFPVWQSIVGVPPDKSVALVSLKLTGVISPVVDSAAKLTVLAVPSPNAVAPAAAEVAPVPPCATGKALVNVNPAADILPLSSIVALEFCNSLPVVVSNLKIDHRKIVFNLAHTNTESGG